ncbi:MAG: hypothetical protein PVG89_03070 [Gammaproteobacteria bacterium]|jgi:hypothetical protein
MMIHRNGKLVLVCLLLAGCATTDYIPGPLAYQTVKPGATLTLHQPLTIEPHSAGVRIQYGKVIPHKLLDQWYPNCRFEVLNPRETKQVIQPETFTITRVTYENYLVRADSVMLAQVGIGISIGGVGGDGDAPTADVYTTFFYLESETQPDVSRLLCEYWEDPADARHLMLEEIQQALGDIISINANPSSGVN